MSGAWLVSYIVLWGLVLFQGLVIFVLLRQLGVMYLGTAQGVAHDGLPVGESAPGFTVRGLEGQDISLADFRGRSLLLVFGSPDCVPCRRLIPDLNVFARERAVEAHVLFLSRGNEEDSRGFANENDVQVPVAILSDDELAGKYRARVTPFAFLIDGEGVIRAKGLANNREHLEMLVRMAKEQAGQPAGGPGRNGADAEQPPVVEREAR
jgi:methylamine dehydrogenase accessory protein MauD